MLRFSSRHALQVATLEQWDVLVVRHRSIPGVADTDIQWDAGAMQCLVPRPAPPAPSPARWPSIASLRPSLSQDEARVQRL